MMNAHARKLGLSDTHYVRPEGLDAPDEFSSGRDVTKLARILMRRPLVRAIVRKTNATISGARTILTRNNLLYRFPGTIGVKTGHTSGAGWCEVAAVRRNGLTIYATVLGAPSESRRDADLVALLRWGLSQYRPATLVPAHTAYARLPSGFGRDSVPAVAAHPLVRSVRIGRPLVEQVVLPDGVSLPVRRGQPLGTVRLYAGGRLLGERRLVAARAVSAPGLADRVGWYLGRALHDFAGWFG